VWEGNARIQILLREWDGHQEPGGKQIVEVLDSTLELNSNPKMPNEKNGTGYVVELRRLEPMPREGAPTSNYVATLLARKP
jgi:hypothetical protein